MKIIKILKEIDELKEKVLFAKEISKIIEPQLPKGWGMDFIIEWSNPGILIGSRSSQKKSENPISDFLFICKIMEEEFKIKITAKPWIEDDFIYCLHGRTELIWKTEGEKEYYLPLEIRQFQTDTCKVEIIEKTVKVAKMSEDCIKNLEVE